MSPERLLDVLAFPENCLVDQRVPKTVLTAQAATGAADKRLIKQEIEALFWIAALKPDTIGVAAYKDDLREYLEIAVIHVVFRQAVRTGRLIELIHRAIPYPVLLIVESSSETSLSMAHKRWAQNERDRTVLEEDFPQTVPVTDKALGVFFDRLALSTLPQTHMLALYSGWLDVLTALEAFYVTGRFKVAEALDEIPGRRAALHQIKEIELKISRIRKRAAKENQMSRLVELNMELKQLQKTRQALLEKI